jgi:hypothetical protein
VVEMLLSNLPTHTFSAKARWEDDSKEASSSVLTGNHNNSNVNVNVNMSVNGSGSGDVRRKGTTTTSNDESSENNNTNGTTEETDNDFHGVQKEPLMWFGVLISPHLRTSQNHFKKCKINNN